MYISVALILHYCLFYTPIGFVKLKKYITFRPAANYTNEFFVKKNILCFGDSNTWGLNPETGKRYNDSIRWPSRMSMLLGDNFNVIEAGQPNRTLVNNPPFIGGLNGICYLKPYLETESLDIIIIALGTNDLKKRFDLSPRQIAKGLEELIEQIELFYNAIKKPNIIILSPAHVKAIGTYKHIYDGAMNKNQPLTALFETLCKKKCIHYFDLQQRVNVSKIDGIHLCSQAHTIIASSLYKIIKNITN